ncbi:hypothetical protein CC1G_15510 [Coprinopsis cinerea okayama7|uniref:Uncharacterized protein n=1 Tax=Coprinopsis cinerea (strain Okayama-7 / 130 / ATCC MYA-4618 / FGSC 9003) TaxID=240176 RepID=D6RN91_COPC7|nr:hypothetical protein CC1G_15510 [Coprinopsis cinerea okayama7\|eukprot:XP_002910969.1 hypothetical protein CC1G_15510 [Coprinopsis cinerea okayama7\
MCMDLNSRTIYQVLQDFKKHRLVSNEPTSSSHRLKQKLNFDDARITMCMDLNSRTIYQVLQDFKKNRLVSNEPTSSSHRLKQKLNFDDARFIRCAIEQKPDIYLDELRSLVRCCGIDEL